MYWLIENNYVCRLPILLVLCILSDITIFIHAHQCEVGQEHDENNTWRWVLPYKDPCHYCTSVALGGANPITPKRSFKPVYVDKPMITNDVSMIIKHYCMNIDECNSSPCQNGGSCIDQVNNYTCSCLSGWTGINCEADIDECTSGPCVYGMCDNNVNQYSCNCEPGWQGINCDVDIDECNSSSCQNGGSCINEVNNFTCQCKPGWQGINCDVDIDECNSSPCQNGGSCIDQVNNYTCQCRSGWTGLNCEAEFDECTSGPCVHGMCDNDQLNDIDQYSCNCEPGWQGNNCDVDTDECNSSPCQNGGSCVDQVNNYICQCPSGWTGRNCEADIDECTSAPCVHGMCDNDVDQYSCKCEPGWQGINCDEDIDECSSSPCQHGGSCIDHVNSYTCQCPCGWTGHKCEANIDECITGSCVHGMCDNCDGDDWNGHCYNYVASLKSWCDAEVYCCSQYGAHLVSIHSSEENDFVKGLIGSDRTWIGLNDKNTEDAFEWSDGTQVNYTDWRGNQPNNADGGEDCAHFLDRPSKKWSDFKCHSEMKFVCKK
ncbi:uncharacterized protein [Amphiura filiformis]|uniref:uncharacterized protein n=1 Tax=Amphiura filiformis TaxID=82378 RepID=UPI003B224A56